MSLFIKGEKVDLFAPDRDDIPFIVELANHPEIRRFTSRRFPLYTDDVEDYIFSKDMLFLIIKDKEKNRVGTIQLGNFNHINRRCMLSLSIHPDFQNKGYGTESVKLIVDYAFKVLQMHKVGLEVYSFNERAIRVYEKLGFVKEGHYRRHSYKDGKYVDLYYMAILEDEYMER